MSPFAPPVVTHLPLDDFFLETPQAVTLGYYDNYSMPLNYENIVAGIQELREKTAKRSGWEFGDNLARTQDQVGIIDHSLEFFATLNAEAEDEDESGRKFLASIEDLLNKIKRSSDPFGNYHINGIYDTIREIVVAGDIDIYAY